MAPPSTNNWETDTNDALLNYLIKRTENIESPMSIHSLARDFKEKSGAAQTVGSLRRRIQRMRSRIHSFEHIDTKTKVKLLFALSAPVGAAFLKELNEDALVKVDEKKQITHYKANDGSLELKGGHSQSAKIKTARFKSKRTLRSLIIDYFKNKDNTDAVPKNKKEKEMWQLIEFITEKCQTVDSPLKIHELTKDFNNRFGMSIPLESSRIRIRRYCWEIQKTEFLDTHSKVRQLFGLSATLDSECLEELRKDAFVEVDDLNRITKYTANDGRLTLHGNHSSSAKHKTAQLESKGSLRSLINNYFEKTKDYDAVPENDEEKEMRHFIEFVTEKCENVNAPLSISQLTKDFNKYFEIARSLGCIVTRVKGYCNEIQNMEFMDTPSKVKQLFGLSATLDSNFLEQLRKDASVEVDGMNRITNYKAKDGILELRGDHSHAAKRKTVQFEHRNFIRNYFIHKNDADVVPRNKEEKEMWNFIEFITERCKHADSPLSITQLTRDFNNHFGIARSRDCLHYRVKGYCCKIQKMETLDTLTEVKQLFCLSATLDSDYLKKLRKDAVVEVDHLNRIKKYTANDGSLTLHGDHNFSAKARLALIEGTRRKNRVMKHSKTGCDENEESERDDGYSEDDSDEYSSEDFDSEFDSDDENDPLDEPDLMVSSNKVLGFDNETPTRNRLSSEMSIDDNFDFEPVIESSHKSEETEMGENEENDPGITGNAVIRTRSGRLLKRRHLDSNFSYDLANSSSSRAFMGSSYPKPAKHFHPLTERSHVSKVIEIREDDGRKRKNISFTAAITQKMRNSGTTGYSSSKRARPSASDSMRPNEMNDYDTNYSIEDQVKLEPFRGSIQEDFKEINGDEDIQQIPKPLQAHDEHNQIEDVTIKVESEDLKIVENPTEDVKPEIAQAHDKHKERIEVPIKVEYEEPVEVKPEASHNSKINFFEAMHSLILCLDTPSLSWIQTKIHQKILCIEGQDEVILNNVIVQIIELLIARMTNHFVVNLSENVESVNLSNFLCYLKAAILNSKMSGMEVLVQNISELIEESQNKRISMENVANALRATLDIHPF